jgi:16S rRNA C1402 (ribose-2'-O) methylase RsmI
LQFWRGTLGEANEAFATRQPKGEITVLIEGKLISVDETPSEDFLEHELRELTAKGYTLSAVHMQPNSLLQYKFQLLIFFLLNYCAF